ncbi:sel1 repeat family protein [Amphritea balenae]|uniref:Sel1 repeat family protein n=1 Tax=Amphritea balenae TaxID=452629 RepID=A0A3P1SIB5_9GAMM|nr:SEL1-like repeat protein [Amphritea balenae]RRC96764.1 sel1 repeat family protein [Amphritea balenae]
MNKLLSILLFLLSLSAHAQMEPHQLCYSISSYINLDDAAISELQSVTDKYYQKAFAQAPEIAKGFAKLPDNWLKQSLLAGLATCYLEGINVEIDMEKGKQLLSEAAAIGSKEAAHRLASIRMLMSPDPEEKRLGFEYLNHEFAEGSAYAAGKLGWAYQHGFGVTPDINKALELYHYAAEKGMTYWQYLLAHAYEKGYLGLKVNHDKTSYWLNDVPKVHIAKYECWVANYYENGTFPQNEEEHQKYSEKCYLDNK